jgi:hypothetical protein
MELSIISLSVMVLALFASTITLYMTARKLYLKLKDAEDLLEIKNEHLKDYIEDLDVYHKKLWEAEYKLAVESAPKKRGRPFGSRNKATAKKPGPKKPRKNA